MFALTDLEDEFAVTLKCDPEYSIALQELHTQITGAYHMNKKHWIGIHDAASFDEKLLKKLIDDSYGLVFKSLPRRISGAIASK